MRKVYLDNAATTQVYDEVITLMGDSMRQCFGNPSSIHHFGRTAKSLIENSRKGIAKHLGVSSSEIIFTSGGTEANNLILRNAVVNLGVTKIVTSKLEHHAVLRTVKSLEIEFGIELNFVETNAQGKVDIVNLRSLLEEEITGKTLVSLMFVNNEIGSILDVKKVASICEEYDALFHSDAVQAVGHFDVDLRALNVDFISASAHKFHGPKGVGFAYFKEGHGVKPMLLGGEQEKGARAGTEPVHAIVGMEKALDISIKHLESGVKSILELKKLTIDLIQKSIPSIQFNAGSENLKDTTATILNIRLPLDSPFLLFNLDMKGIAVSGGSACQSGSEAGSHVLGALLSPTDVSLTSMRISFSTFTTKEDIVYFLASLEELLVK
ncbi:cysteine desulfurase family protein [Flavicella sp.]|uniref:cysteine desulfurase family protein n=1 Tax=Flavicella sp. TaxID=2957742 RepID=UPI00301AEE34